MALVIPLGKYDRNYIEGYYYVAKYFEWNINKNLILFLAYFAIEINIGKKY